MRHDDPKLRVPLLAGQLDAVSLGTNRAQSSLIAMPLPHRTGRGIATKQITAVHDLRLVRSGVRLLRIEQAIKEGPTACRVRQPRLARPPVGAQGLGRSARFQMQVTERTLGLRVFRVEGGRIFKLLPCIVRTVESKQRLRAISQQLGSGRRLREESQRLLRLVLRMKGPDPGKHQHEIAHALGAGLSHLDLVGGLFTDDQRARRTFKRREVPLRYRWAGILTLSPGPGHHGEIRLDLGFAAQDEGLSPHHGVRSEAISQSTRRRVIPDRLLRLLDSDHPDALAGQALVNGTFHQGGHHPAFLGRGLIRPVKRRHCNHESTCVRGA